MRKGQVSFDFMLAVIAALVFVGSLGALSGQITGMQKEAAVRQQLHSIGLELSGVLGAGTTISDGGIGSAITYKIPKIIVPGEEAVQACDITIGGGVITLGYDLGGAPVQETVSFKEPAGMSWDGSPNCGGTITIFKELI